MLIRITSYNVCYTKLLRYAMIPQKMQGRVFAARNAIQFGTIPIGILLGGFLADSVFEPFMAADSKIAATLSRLVGQGTGSGVITSYSIHYTKLYEKQLVT